MVDDSCETEVWLIEVQDRLESILPTLTEIAGIIFMMNTFNFAKTFTVTAMTASCLMLGACSSVSPQQQQMTALAASGAAGAAVGHRSGGSRGAAIGAAVGTGLTGTAAGYNNRSTINAAIGSGVGAYVGSEMIGGAEGAALGATLGGSVGASVGNGQPNQ